MSEKKPIREILAPMSTKERVNYIWFYYKALIIGVILVATTITYIVLQTSGQKDIAFNIMIAGEGLDTIQLGQIEEELTHSMLNDEEKENSQVLIQSVPISLAEGNNNLSVAMQRVVAEIASESLDVLFIEKGQFELMNEEDYLYDLNSLFESKISIKNEKFYTVGEHLTGIHVSAIKPFYQAITGDVIMCVPANSQNIELIKSFLNNIEIIE